MCVSGSDEHHEEQLCAKEHIIIESAVYTYWIIKKTYKIYLFFPLAILIIDSGSWIC